MKDLVSKAEKLAANARAQVQRDTERLRQIQSASQSSGKKKA